MNWHTLLPARRPRRPQIRSYKSAVWLICVSRANEGKKGRRVGASCESACAAIHLLGPDETYIVPRARNARPYGIARQFTSRRPPGGRKRKVPCYGNELPQTQKTARIAAASGSPQGDALSGRHQGTLDDELTVVRACHPRSRGHSDLGRHIGLLLCLRAGQSGLPRDDGVRYLPEILHRNIQSVLHAG